MCESPDSDHVTLRMHDTLEKLVEEVIGWQMGMKEKPTLENLGGERDENRNLLFANRSIQDFTLKEPAFIHFPQRGVFS